MEHAKEKALEVTMLRVERAGDRMCPFNGMQAFYKANAKVELLQSGQGVQAAILAATHAHLLVETAILAATHANLLVEKAAVAEMKLHVKKHFRRKRARAATMRARMPGTNPT